MSAWRGSPFLRLLAAPHEGVDVLRRLILLGAEERKLGGRCAFQEAPGGPSTPGVEPREAQSFGRWPRRAPQTVITLTSLTFVSTEQYRCCSLLGSNSRSTTLPRTVIVDRPEGGSCRKLPGHLGPLPLEQVWSSRSIGPPPLVDGGHPTLGTGAEADLQRCARSSASTSSASISWPASISAREASNSLRSAARSSSSR